VLSGRIKISIVDEFGDISVVVGDDYVAEIELHRPPTNFFDVTLLRCLVQAITFAHSDRQARAVVLCSQGKHFCAGADFQAASDATPAQETDTGELYREAVRLFQTPLPIVAAVQGAAIGGGLGLACAADFRVCGSSTRMSANFALLGIHQGFGLSASLPAIVGLQRAAELLYTGRRISGQDAYKLGLADRFVDNEGGPPGVDVRIAAHELAAEIASSAPLAVSSIRTTMRSALIAAVQTAVVRESAEQRRLLGTQDSREALLANAERRTPEFQGR
jgi:2-(1,2-epoxy-1,2-dihydrophenyl)acetyl-CoA isomerase